MFMLPISQTGIKTATRLAAEAPLSARVLPHTAFRPAEPLVALHGISRDARAVWAAFAPLLKEQGRALIVPRYSRKVWPQFQRIDKVRPDLALLALLDRLSSELDIATQKFELFGYSGGAQLAHRFAMLYPHRVTTLHIAAPGWYCLPDKAIAWPQGLGTPTKGLAPRLALHKQRQLTAFLSLPVRLYVGAEDTAVDPALRCSPEIFATQGKTRLERAQNYLLAFRRAAQCHGITPSITLRLLPGCGHDFTDCALRGGMAGHVLHTGAPTQSPLTASN